MRLSGASPSRTRPRAGLSCLCSTRRAALIDPPEASHHVQSSELALDIKRVLLAPRSLLFKACTEPDELAKWWGPRGFTAPRVEVDLVVGGSYRIAMQPPDGDVFYLSGEFREVDPPAHLAYTFRWEDPDPDDQETVVTLSLGAAACTGPTADA